MPGHARLTVDVKPLDRPTVALIHHETHGVPQNAAPKSPPNTNYTHSAWVAWLPYAPGAFSAVSLFILLSLLCRIAQYRYLKGKEAGLLACGSGLLTWIALLRGTVNGRYGERPTTHLIDLYRQ